LFVCVCVYVRGYIGVCVCVCLPVYVFAYVRVCVFKSMCFTQG